MKKTLATILSALAVSAGSSIALAQANWPAKPVTLVIPFTAGGTTDNEFRHFLPRLQESTGQPFVFDFRAGAATTIGTAYVAKAAPDGYTLLLQNAGLTVHPNFYPDLPYQVQKSFEPVTQVSGGSTIVMVSTAALPNVHSMQDLIAWGRANPGKLNCNTAGQGGVTHIVCAALSAAMGVPITPVHYKGVSQGQVDLIAGRTQVAAGTLFNALTNIKAGKIRAIAVTTAKRSAAAPEIPTVAETIPGFEATTWFAVFAPAGTPKPVVDRLNAEVLRVFRLPEVAERLKTLGLEAVLSSPEELAGYQASEIVKWTKVVKESGARAE